MSDELFSALFGVFGEQEEIKLYAFLDDKGRVVASGTETLLPFAQQLEIDAASHQLCLEKGADLLVYQDGKLAVKDIEITQGTELIYVNYANDQTAVAIKVAGSTASAKITKRGLIELEQFAAKGKLTSKIWLLDADHRHRCVAELKIGSDFIMDSVKLEYIPKRIIAATYPVFSNYSFEQE